MWSTCSSWDQKSISDVGSRFYILFLIPTFVIFGAQKTLDFFATGEDGFVAFSGSAPKKDQRADCAWGAQRKEYNMAKFESYTPHRIYLRGLCIPKTYMVAYSAPIERETKTNRASECLLFYLSL